MFANIYNGKRVLITGDSGFKGSWLSIWLKLLGADVYGYSLPPITELDNYVICNLPNHIHHLDGDIRDYNKFYNYVNEIKPEFIFHLAAQALVLDSYSDPKKTYETNILGVVNMFEAVRSCDSVRVAINVTSDKCYQNNGWVWGYKEIDAMGGNDPYSASKGASELITNSYLNSYFQNKSTANIASVRAGNVIGGGDWARNRIVPDFFRAIEKKETLNLRNPESTRPWQYVLEPLSGYLLLGEKLYNVGKEYSGGWNIGPIGDTNQSVRNLIEKIIECTKMGSYSTPKNIQNHYEASFLNLDVSKAMHMLSWKPVLSFEETVLFTVEGYNITHKNSSLYNHRKNQIERYCKLANERNISWI
jgi:CDP-glucose 4,6-dehydratase